jgi:ATP-binding cassette, subfamily B, bacterial
MKYGLLKNILYVYRKAFHFNRKLMVFLPILIICGIVIPMFATVIPATAVGLITEGYGVGKFVLILGGIIACYGLFLFTYQYLLNIFEYENIFVRIKEFYYELSVKLMRTDYVNVEPQKKQVLIQKALNSIGSNWGGIEFMMKNAPFFFINAFGLMVYGTAILALDVVIILIMVGMSVFNYLLNLYGHHYEEKHKPEYTKLDRQIDYLFENSKSLINGKDVRIYKMETWFYQLFKSLTKKRVSWSRKMEYRYFIPSLSDNILLFVRDILAYGLLITLVLEGSIDVAIFTLYVGIIGGFSNWMNETVRCFTNLKRANLGVNDYRQYDEIEEVFNHHKGVELPTSYPLDIEFKNVSFTYPGAEQPTISNLNFKIEKGSKVALVGNNGAGKTTIVKLLTGLYYPTEGEILINGISIKDFNIKEYHQLIGAVYQDVEILAFTIAKNVAATVEQDINYEKVHQSLALAGLKDKVDSLKEREQTHLTQQLNEAGILLSGGEMQKLMLARALYKDAPIMILDEPTAALDPIAEAELYEKYNDLTKEKTSLFISHRLSSTKFCDRILFLEKGQIIEDGNHQDLMALNRKYAEMFTIQSHYYKEEGEVTND